MPRLDQILVDRGLFPSREQAKRAVMAGAVKVNGQPAAKPGAAVRPSVAISVAEGQRFVSRGGLKLEHALNSFELDVEGLRGVDVGASTGGFTDCLLQRGAACVYAVDVGQGLLAWKLRQDPRVVAMERLNARHLTKGHFPQPFEALDFAAIDCSFISLRLLLARVSALLSPAGKIIALVKPQFEAGKQEADRGRGIIRDPSVHDRVLTELEAFANASGEILWRRSVESPILGGAGNKEFLALLERTN